MAIGVQTDMCTLALARFGSDELREEFPPGHRRRDGRLHRRLRGRRRLDAWPEDHRAQGLRRRLRADQRQQDVDHQLAVGRLHVPARQYLRRQAAVVNKSLIVVLMKTLGITLSPHLDKLGMRSLPRPPRCSSITSAYRSGSIGAEGAGFMMQMLQFQEERLFGAANMTKGPGAPHRRHHRVLQGARGPRPAADRQPGHPTLRMAEMMTEVEALRALVYQATELYVKGRT